MCLTTRLINGFLITCEDLFVGFKDFKLVNLEKPRLVSYIVSNYVYHFKNGWAIPNNVNQAILNAFYYDSRYSFPVTLFVGFKEEHLQKVGQEVVVVSTFTIISPFQADSILKNIYDYICRLTTNQEINEEIATLCRDISFLYCIVYNNIQPAMRGVYND